jgi:hypothetical protein
LSYLFIAENQVFIFGGRDEKNKARKECFVFNFDTHSLVQKTNMNKPRFWHCGYMINETVFVFGGDEDKTAEEYCFN